MAKYNDVLAITISPFSQNFYFRLISSLLSARGLLTCNSQRGRFSSDQSFEVKSLRSESEMRRIIGILLLSIVGLDAIDLQCEFVPIKNWAYVSGTGCIASIVNITSRQIITSVNGQNNFDGSNYKMVRIDNQVVNFIPEGLGKFFPNLEGLRIASSELKKVEKKDLGAFPKLKEFSFESNEIKFLPSDLFEGNLELQLLYFNSNPITHVGHNLVSPLKKLERAHFKSTKCINKHYYTSEISSLVADLRANCPEPTQEMIKKAEEIGIKTPKPTDSKVGCEAKVKNLERINDALTRQLFILSTQQSDVKSLPLSVDFKCKMTEKSCDVVDLVVELSRSKIGKVRDENGTEVESVKKIRIVDQATLFLPTNLAEKFPKVTEIFVDSSGFFQLDSETFSNLTLLTSLTIVNNKMRQIPVNALADSMMMTKLDLSSNRLEVIDSDAFVGLSNLVELNLSHNLLTHISPAVFANLTSLQTLLLQFNQMKFLVSAVFSSLNQLSHIDVSSKCFCLSCILFDLMTFRSQTTSSKAYSQTSLNQATRS
jgi:Leucine-rich repeat (LRR) protein